MNISPLAGVVSGLLANVAVMPTNKTLSQLITEQQKQREQAVREGSPHDVGGRKFGERLLDRKLSKKEERAAQVLFTLGYGAMWGAIYWGVRRMVPQSSRYLGLPFAVGFYLACDGVLAPKLALSPRLKRIPWQFNAKEFLNHIVWTAAAETFMRSIERIEATERT